MIASAPPRPSQAGVRSALTEAREFASLLELFRVCAGSGCLPPLPARLHLKQLEADLPAPLAKYIWFLHLYPRRPGYLPTTALSRKACCGQCGIAPHPEWVSSIASGQVIYVCACCAAVFVPSPTALRTAEPDQEA